jgi:hypothetical protein
MTIAPAVPPAPINPNSRLAPRTGNSSAVTSQKPDVSRSHRRAGAGDHRPQGGEAEGQEKQEADHDPKRVAARQLSGEQRHGRHAQQGHRRGDVRQRLDREAGQIERLAKRPAEDQERDDQKGAAERECDGPDLFGPQIQPTG